MDTDRLLPSLPGGGALESPDEHGDVSVLELQLAIEEPHALLRHLPTHQHHTHQPTTTDPSITMGLAFDSPPHHHEAD